MTPEQQARTVIDRLLEQSGWTVQNINNFNKDVSVGIAVREFPTNTGSVDYALFIDGKLVGIIEAKKTDSGENIISVEEQAARYASSAFKWVTEPCQIRFVYEATGDLIRFTDYADIRYRSRQVFSFHQPETLRLLLKKKDTVRNCLKKIPVLNPEGFRKCQINAIQKLDESFADNRPRALIQMATGAGKTVTAITAVYRMLKFANMNRILFLVDTKTLGEQAEQEFRRYIPNDDMCQFSNIYGVYRLKSSRMPQDVQVYISTIQRMYSILKGEKLDESAEETTLFEYTNATKDKPKVVVYNQKYPPEFFDCIIVDECHRSIYNVWSQVLEYFDAFIIGLTATPDKRTFAFFHENIVSQYTRDEAIADGMNVGEDIFIIETEITKNGAHLERQSIEYRNRLSRIKEWKELDEEIDYKPSQLDRSVVNPSQIRTVIRAFREALRTKKIFPDRTIVPKTLIFAKNNSHASDIVDIVREEFGEGNDFCKKITYSVEKPEKVLNDFRTGLNPRIAVTVDMIATGTDVKPIESLIFMRDVRSENYFEQMKGRGTRTLSKEELQLVTPDAKEAKDQKKFISRLWFDSLRRW